MIASVSPELSIVIPAFQEEARLGRTLSTVVAYLSQQALAAEVIVVDDGSHDRTFEVAASQGEPVHVLRLAANRGKGAALREGVAASSGELVLLCDADLSTPIEELPKLAAALDAGAALAFGSRGVATSDVQRHQARYRELMGRCFNVLLHLLGIGGIRDTQCGFKLLRGEVARELFRQLRLDGFAYDVELLVLARRRGLRIAEVGVVWVDSPGSRVDPVRDSARMFRDVLRVRFARRRGGSAA